MMCAYFKTMQNHCSTSVMVSEGEGFPCAFLLSDSVAWAESIFITGLI